VSNVKDMNQRAKTIFIYLPKVIVFSLSLLNILYIQSYSYPLTTTGTTISFVEFSPWYEKSTMSVLILFIASFLLMIGRRKSYAATILSGYIFAYGLFYTIRSINYFGFFGLWNGIQKTEPNIFLAEEIQWILAGVIFSCSSFYLMGDIWHKKTSQNRFV